MLFKKLKECLVIVPVLKYPNFCPDFLFLLGLGILKLSLIKPEEKIVPNVVAILALVVETVTTAGIPFLDQFHAWSMFT